MGLPLDHIQLRDPFILPVPQENAYYLFGSSDKDIWQGPATGFDHYRSHDLAHWDGPFESFRPAPDFWSRTEYWAPEVHFHDGRYFMFATFTAPGLRRGTQILVSESPGGPFTPHSAGPVTPRDWECLDGTLHVDDGGQPWMVFCHEWVQVGDGTVCAIRLADDLSASLGEPVVLFAASSAPWAEPVHSRRHGTGHVTDGPFMHRTRGGALVMLWASFRAGRYAQGLAVSETGAIDSAWVQDEPLYEADGGHGMLFRSFQDQLFLTLHTPNNTPDERPVLIPLVEDGDELRVDR